ncbi:hypothetical protein GF312_15475 [Candidatus Poribacteria bacterium]|nr:hypothetical protein [Candidatus Poribacteria bacterium]
MIKKEIVKNTLAFKESKVTPYHLDFTPPVKKMLIEYYGTEDLDTATGNYIKWISWRPSITFHGERLDNHLVKDEFGVIWKVLPQNRGYVVKHPLENPDISNYQFPNSYAEGRFAGIEDRINNSDLFMLAWCGDLFERAQFMRGLSEILTDMYINPDFVHNLLDKITEFVLGNIEQLGNFGVDGIFLSDDYGHQQSLLMSPKHWREFIKPYLAKIIDSIKSKGLYAFLHSCGNISEIIPELIEIGLDVLHPIQPEAMDIFDIKRRHGDRLTLYGGISTQNTLPNGSPEEVRNEVLKIKEIMSKNSGYILAPGITLQHDIPLENIIAFIDAAK